MRNQWCYCSQNSSGPARQIYCDAVFSTGEFRLRSPLFPARYPPNQQCSYIVQAVSSNICELEVNSLTFDVAQSTDCSADHLDIAGERLCGGFLGVKRFRFSPPRSLIRFRSVASSGGKGFDLVVRQIQCPPSTNPPQPFCGGLYRERQFVIQSPGFPGPYPNNAHCIYLIQEAASFPNRHSYCGLEFNFLQFALEPSSQCRKDRLEIGDREGQCGSVAGIQRYQGFLGQVQVRFISDSMINNKGFLIMVTQVPCQSPEIPPPPLPFPPTIPPLLPYPPSARSCCGTTYKGRRFYIFSPGFHYNNVNNIDCFYEIHRFSSRICRLQLHLKFFWVGEEDTYTNGCYNGYLEFDGRRICDCRSGIVLSSPFDGRFGNIKYLRYKSSDGANRGGGFVIEVLQEECRQGWGRSDQDIDVLGNNVTYFINPTLLGGNATDVDNVDLTTDDVLTEDLFNYTVTDQSVSVRGGQANTDQMSLYSNMSLYDCVPVIDNSGNGSGFAVKNMSRMCNMNSQVTGRSKREVPSTGTIEDRRLNANPQIHTLFPYPASSRPVPPSWLPASSCRHWGFQRWLNLAKQFLWSVVPHPKCPVQTSSPVQQACHNFDTIQGWVQTLNYPRPYESNTNTCYRFRRVPGYCKLQLTLLDFDVAGSPGCVQDFLLIHGRGRYCGQTLAPATMILDLSSTGYSDIIFVSDSVTTGRGFSATFTQLPCTSQPLCATEPPRSLPYGPPSLCGGVYHQYNFKLTNHGSQGSSTCNFKIIRANPDVCELHLSLVDFDLMCGQESLQIRNKFYCGRLSGQFLKLEFGASELNIVYWNTRSDRRSNLHIEGQQVVDCQPFNLNVTPAARIFEDSSDCVIPLMDLEGRVLFQTPNSTFVEPPACSYVIQPQPGICAVKLNFTDFELPNSTNCSTAFLKLEGTKYCHLDLKDSTKEISFNNKEIEIPYAVQENSTASLWDFIYTKVLC